MSDTSPQPFRTRPTPVLLPGGLDYELGHLTLDEVCAHLDNYLGNMLLEPVAAFIYINRLSRAPELQEHPEAMRRTAYLTYKYALCESFEHKAQAIALRFRTDPAMAARRAVLEKLAPGGPDIDRAMRLLVQGRGDMATRLLAGLLESRPADASAAANLLRIDHTQGRPPGDWLALFRCPKPLETAWLAKLLIHLTEVGETGAALDVWARLSAAAKAKREQLDETVLNAAAASLARAGETAKACVLYTRSLNLDPLQDPVRRRLEELKNPTRVRPELLGEKRITVCVYSWNKAHMLKATLEGLADSDIGPSRVKVLLNGCTDDSAAVVEAVRARFADSLEVVSLPVNVGAPAARNWLAALPECRQADHVAYLDDDVTLPPDWLARLLTVAEDTPGVGVVGCKAVFPGRPARYQYLYRNVAVVRADMIRLSLPTVLGMDTGLYDFVRTTANVMGCCHLLSRGLLDKVPGFDLRFSPSQMDDMAHDLDARLAGFKVVYNGLVTCVHHQSSGVGLKSREDYSKLGNVAGNDVKFFYKIGRAHV